MGCTHSRKDTMQMGMVGRLHLERVGRAEKSSSEGRDDQAVMKNDEDRSL